MPFSADTSTSLHAKFDQCLAVLVQERRVLAELVSLTMQVRQALVSSDAAMLATLVERQEPLIQHLLELDRSRQGLMEMWLAQDEWQRGGYLEAQRIHLLAIYEDVRWQARALQRANAVNRRLLAGVARWVDGLLHQLTGLLGQEAPYDQRGLRAVRSRSNWLIDHQV